MKLREYLKEYTEDISEEYQDLTDAERDFYRGIVEETRAEKTQGYRDKPKVLVKHVKHTFDRMEQDVSPHIPCIIF